MPVKRVGNCLLFRWEAQAAKPGMWLCDLKHSAGERRKKNNQLVPVDSGES